MSPPTILRLLAPRRSSSAPLLPALLLPALLLAALQLSSLAGAATAADPFYVELLRDGSRALQSGEHGEASRLLRLACFGLLEEPPVLAECLVKLSLAQAGLGQRKEFEETFDRIAALEERFQALAAADLTSELEDAFTQRAVVWIPGEHLQAIPRLAAAFDRRTETELAELPPTQRRQRLATLQSSDPGDARWPRLLAELELSEGNAAAAAAAAAAVLQLEPGDRASQCVQGRARAALGQCQEALADLGACQATASAGAATVDRLECLSALSRWPEAASLLGTLTPALLQEPRVRRLSNRIEKEQAKLSRLEQRQDQQAAAEQQRLEREARRAAQRGPQRPPSEDPSRSGVPARSADAGAPPVSAAAERVEEAASSAVVSDPDTDPEREGDANAAAESTTADSEPPLSASERSSLERARALARNATLSTDLAEPMRLARPVADQHPDHRDAQHLVAEIAYRASDWQTAIRYFDRGGDPGGDQPILLFYQAIALYESGKQERAAQALRRSLGGLKRDPWVDSYVTKILGPQGSQ